jgi:hypothetical protein
MATEALYSLNEAQRRTGENRNLITFLVQDRGIPVVLVGRTKAIDHDGLVALKRAIAEYRAKARPEAATLAS